MNFAHDEQFVNFEFMQIHTVEPYLKHIFLNTILFSHLTSDLVIANKHTPFLCILQEKGLFQ